MKLLLSDRYKNYIDLSGCKTLLDIGGGSGLYSISFCKKYQGLHSTILDKAETLITTFGEYAEENEVGRHKIKFERLISAENLWLEAKKLAQESKYEQAIIETEKLISDYSDKSSINFFIEGIITNAGTIPPFSERYPIHEILTDDGRYVEFNGHWLNHKKINIIDKIIRYDAILKGEY